MRCQPQCAKFSKSENESDMIRICIGNLKVFSQEKKCLTTQTKKGSCCLNETGELLVDIFSYVKLKKCDLM